MVSVNLRWIVAVRKAPMAILGVALEEVPERLPRRTQSRPSMHGNGVFLRSSDERCFDAITAEASGLGAARRRLLSLW